MTYSHLRADCLYTGISSGPHAWYWVWEAFTFFLVLLLLLLLLLLLHPFTGLFSRTSWVGHHQKGKPFWILLDQEMMGWQWHQLDHMQIICTLIQTDNHNSASPLSFSQAGCPSCCRTNRIKALKAYCTYLEQHWLISVHFIFQLNITIFLHIKTLFYLFV